jgi:dienelactone hydrolase
MRVFLPVAAVALLVQPAHGQSQSELNATRYGVVLDHPATRNVTVHENVPYLTTPAGRQDLDIYLPPGLKSGERRPTVICLNAIGDQPGNTKVKRWESYRSWPRLVAAHGLVGISMDADPDRIQECLRGLFRFVDAEGAAHGVDATRLGVYAASANVTGTSVYLFGDSVSRGIRAAALYYGQVPPQSLRSDLPVLFIVAEGDAPGMGLGLPALWQRVVESRAPWRLLFGSRLPHAFDAVEDTDDSRRVMLETIAFWKSYLEPVPPRSEPPSATRAVVASFFWNQPARSVPLLESWISSHPDDGEAWMQLGRQRAALQRFPGADSAYQQALRLGVQTPGLYLGLGQLRMGTRQWDQAAEYLTRAIDLGARHSLAYGQLAYTEMHRGRYAEAVTAYERAFEAGIPPGANTRGVAYYNLACAHARLGHTDQAFDNLTKAIESGFSNRNTMAQDPDLESLRSDPRFRVLLDRLPNS